MLKKLISLLCVTAFLAAVYVYCQGGLNIQSKGKIGEKLYQFQCILNIQDKVHTAPKILKYPKL